MEKLECMMRIVLCSQFVLQPLQQYPHRRSVLFARVIDGYMFLVQATYYAYPLTIQ